MALTAPGLGSGLDINGLVSQLMALEQRPALALDRKEASFQAQLTAFGTLKGALAALQSAAAQLATPDKFAGRKAIVADSSLVSVAATSSAAVGSYSVEVQHLAQSQKLKSAAFADASAVVGEGTVTIAFGRYETAGADINFVANPDKPAQAVTIPATATTLADIRDAINNAGLDVSATLVNDGGGSRLVLTSSDTGLDNALRIMVNDADGNHADNAGLSRLAYDATVTGGVPGTQNLSEAVAAKDAVVILDGITITRSGNTIAEAADGLTFTLLKEAAGETTVLTVSQDKPAVSAALQSFVNAYNGLARTIKNVAGYDAATQRGGPLLGDSAVRSIESQVRNILFASVPTGTAGFGRLTDVGVSFQTDGTLALDTSKLESALSASAGAVASLFSTANSGIAVRLDAALDGVLDLQGILNSRSEGINSSIKDIGERRERLEARLLLIERRYRAQFTALDSMIASMTQTSNFLQQQLANLPKISGGEN